MSAETLDVVASILICVGMLAFVIGFVIVMMAVFGMVENLGDELHDYFEGEDE